MGNENHLSTSSSSSSSLSPSPPPTAEEHEVATAAAFVSLSGSCRRIGDIYLACVATAGLGQCRHLRKAFADCVNAAHPSSLEMLQHTIGPQVCPNETNKEKVQLCAAHFINQQYFPSRSS